MQYFLMIIKIFELQCKSYTQIYANLAFTALFSSQREWPPLIVVDCNVWVVRLSKNCM